MQPTTARHMTGGLRKIKDTVVGHNNVTVINVVIVVDNVEGCTQMSSKTVRPMDVLVADVERQTTG